MDRAGERRPVTRPGGVTAAAVLLCIGSLLCVGLAALVIAVLALRPSPEMREASAAFRAAAFVPGVVLAGVGVWGFVTAAGLWRLRRWSRISVLLLAGVAVFMGASILIGFLVALSMAARGALPGSPEGTQAALAISTVFPLAIVGVGGWWLAYFNRQSVKQMFAGGEDVSTPRPIGVQVIAWHLVILGPLLLVAVWSSTPAAFLGMLVTGVAAAVVYGLWAVASVWIGVELLRWRPRALDHAVYYFAFGIVNMLAFSLVPGATERNQRMIEATQQALGIRYTPEMLAAQPPPWITYALAIVSCALAIWYLVARKPQYLAACAARSLKGPMRSA